MALNPKKWNKALNMALINSGAFFLLSVSIFTLKSESLLAVLLAPVVFFLGSMYVFYLMVSSGGIVIPVAWFVLGAGVFFGLGVLSGGLHAHPWSEQLYGNDLTYLIDVNMLNSSSVLVVLGVVYIVLRYTENHHHINSKHSESTLIAVFPYIVFIAFWGIALKLMFFPIAEDLLLRSVIDKFYFFVPVCIFLLGMLWRDINLTTKLIASLVFVMLITKGLLGFSKFDVITILSAFIVGVLSRSHSFKSIAISFATIILVYVTINPIVTFGRAHIDYNTQHNSLSDRIDITTSLLSSYIKDEEIEIHPAHNGNSQTVNLDQEVTVKKQIRQIGMRLDVASIQGYLINEYNAGRPGESLDQFWAVLIPRILWKEKPIMTNNAGKLNAQYYGGGEGTELSAIAPTYTAESYWNYGWMGVLMVSLYLGSVIGWFSSMASKLIMEAKSGYFLIAFPAIIIFAHVESWVVPTYVGGLGQLVILLSAYRILVFIQGLKRFNSINKD